MDIRTEKQRWRRYRQKDFENIRSLQIGLIVLPTATATGSLPSYIQIDEQDRISGPASTRLKQIGSWTAYFVVILNRSGQKVARIPINHLPATRRINENAIIRADIRSAIQPVANSVTPGTDNIAAELLTMDRNNTATYYAASVGVK